MDQEVQEILAEYGEFEGGATVAPVSASSGFSDARIWRVTTSGGSFALRAWPPGQPTAPRRAWMHRFLRFLHECGLPWIATPIRTRHGTLFVERRGRTWELAPWLPGQPDRSPSPSEERVTAALRALAEFHRAAALFPPGPVRGQAPGLLDRDSLTRLLMNGDAENLRQSVLSSLPATERSTSIAAKALETIDLFNQCAPRIAGEIASAVPTVVPVLPCLRDVWREHVLFEGDRVTGMIDYGALRSDTVATDISRLLGSLVADDQAGWQLGIAAYDRARRLSDEERSLIGVYDRSSVLLSGTFWVRWIFVDRIDFPDLVRVEKRMDEILGRLRRLRSVDPHGLHFS